MPTFRPWPWRVSPGALERLARLEGVGLIEADRPLFAQGGEKIPAPGKSPPLAPELTGAGVALAFVDTGVDYNTVGPSGFPNDKIIGGYDYGDNDPDPMDCDGHGTGMVLIATTWVAPEAKAFAFKICPGCCHKDPDWISKMLAAWDWCVSQRKTDPAYPHRGRQCELGQQRLFRGDLRQGLSGRGRCGGHPGRQRDSRLRRLGQQRLLRRPDHARLSEPNHLGGSRLPEERRPQGVLRQQQGRAAKEKEINAAISAGTTPLVRIWSPVASNSADFLDILAQSGGRTSGCGGPTPQARRR